jgi:hypothetical protein
LDSANRVACKEKEVKEADKDRYGDGTRKSKSLQTFQNQSEEVWENSKFGDFTQVRNVVVSQVEVFQGL